MRSLVILVVIAAAIYSVLCLALYLAQRSFIYFPQPKSVADLNPPLILNVDDERILVCTSLPARSDASASTSPGAIIYFGGNAEDVRRSLPTLINAFPDRAIYAMNYRGYGGSSGNPSESALIRDALLLFDRVHTDHERITVIGRSLGSGIAVHLAGERSIERLVLITPYDSILNIAAAQFPIFPVRWLLTDKFESWRYAPKVSAPTLLVAAQNDELIPRANTEALYKDFPPSVASLTVIPGVGHDTISESPQYISLLRETP